jgi:hypothetical protein
MKPYSILNTVAQLVTMIVLSISLAGGVHAQDNGGSKPA